ncbi:hypothetical protein SAMN05216390_10919 [Lachnospiraceae bacterium KH1T2]|nr:hypothetical protein SAMN05216390_10919 [Lachnospiraceae bacterium KH1T2]
MSQEYFGIVYENNISDAERMKFHGTKIGFLLNEGFVLKNKPK